MPFAVAFLCHPAGAYACLVTALAAGVYASHTRGFLPAFTATSAGLLTAFAFLHVPPNFAGLALLLLGTVLLQAEFLVPTYGSALVAGLLTSGWGSWWLLEGSPNATGALAFAPRIALAVGGTLLLLAAVLRGFRLRTL